MGDLQVIERKFLLLVAFCFVASSSLSQVHSFLYHQLQPVTSSPSLHSNQSRASEYAFGNLLLSRSQAGASRALEPPVRGDESASACPASCHCNQDWVDCSKRSLVRVPSGFPKDTKRIRLEWNNITEIGPYAFQGLTRLIRIDLSNNNLVKIDPLAFAGGLQSLNALLLYSNKLTHLPPTLFSELSQLTLLLLNTNALQCINRDQFQSLAKLTLLSLHDNNIETIANGSFDGLKNIKTIHLGKNPLICDCNLRWLVNYLDQHPVDTGEAKCAAPLRRQARKLSHLGRSDFTCEGNEPAKSSRLITQCAAASLAQDQSCPVGCSCSGSTVDCSSVSQSESRATSAVYELPDIPDDIPVYVARMKINDSRIKRIRQTGLYRRLANSQKLDLGNNRIIDIEDNSINGAGGSNKPERVVLVLVENEQCSVDGVAPPAAQQAPEDPCVSAPRVNAPAFDSPCYNGGSCRSNSGLTSFNYSCMCPPGFAGPLCELNIDDCAEHQCQNGAMCVDGVNSYKCVCRDPTTTGEFCEQLSSFSTSSANSIAPIALPMVAASSALVYEQQLAPQHQTLPPTNHRQQHQAQQILTRSADSWLAPAEESQSQLVSVSTGCKRVTHRKYFDDGNGCQSVRVLKVSECVGACGGSSGCCSTAKVKRRRIRMQCSDGASYVKSVDLIKKCACSSDCTAAANEVGQQVQQQQHQLLANSYNGSQEDQLMQITRLDAVD